MYSLKEIYNRGIVEICNELNILHNLMGIITNKEVIQLQLDDNVFVECEINWKTKESPYIILVLKEHEYHLKEFWLATWIHLEGDFENTTVYVDKLTATNNRTLDYYEPKFIVNNLITDNSYMIMGCKYFGNNRNLILNLDIKEYSFIGNRHTEIIKRNNLKVTVRLEKKSFDCIGISFGAIDVFYEANKNSSYIKKLEQIFNLKEVISIKTDLNTTQKSVIVRGIDSEYNVEYYRILYDEYEHMKLVYMFLAECIKKRFEKFEVSIDIDWAGDLGESTTGKAMG